MTFAYAIPVPIIFPLMALRFLIRQYYYSANSLTIQCCYTA